MREVTVCLPCEVTSLQILAGPTFLHTVTSSGSSDALSASENVYPLSGDLEEGHFLEILRLDISL